MSKLTYRDIEVAGRRVLVRVDFNVPLAEEGGKRVITDDTRITEALPTITYLREKGARVILMSHLGRPKGQVNEKYSLKPVAEHLSKLLGTEVKFVGNCIGREANEAADSLKDGEVLLLENLRFYAQEEANDSEFSQALARLADVYINDAFGTAHRAHASTAGVAAYVPQAAMGALLEKELKFLKEGLSAPERPFLVIMGGAKVSDKIKVIEALLEKADVFLIGGAMAYTFAKAQGIPIGKSLVENDKLDLALDLLQKAQEKGVRFLLPVDNLETQEFKAGAHTRNTCRLEPGRGISDDWEGIDIGSETIQLYQEEIAKAKTIFWNGPMGVFEIPEFARGTFAIAAAVAESGAVTIIGGGDSVTAVNQAGLADKMTFISTGGGASLELIEGAELPGVAALTDA